MTDMTILEQTVRNQQNRYYGKFRAFVQDNADPLGLGRVKLTIPSVLGDAASDWALPCLPYGGAGKTGLIAIPPVGAMVVAEFMEGDVSSPLWTGSFYRLRSDAPDEFPTGDPTVKLWRTESGHLLMFEDKEGQEVLTLRSAREASAVMDENGSLTLTDSNGATVTLDASANEIKIEDANGNSLVMSGTGITVKDANGNEISTAAAGITVKGATIKIEGQSVSIGGSGGEPLVKGQSFMAIFNSHTHNCTAPGAPSGPPLSPLTPSALTMVTTAS